MICLTIQDTSRETLIEHCSVINSTIIAESYDSEAPTEIATENIIVIEPEEIEYDEDGNIIEKVVIEIPQFLIVCSAVQTELIHTEHLKRVLFSGYSYLELLAASFRSVSNTVTGEFSRQTLICAIAEHLHQFGSGVSSSNI